MSDESKSSNAPPWRTETWRLTHGPEGDRQTRWFLARLNDGEMLWSITEPGTPHFIAGALSPADGVALMALRAVDPVIEKMDPGSPDDLRAEINYLRSREAYLESERVLDENLAAHMELAALRTRNKDLHDEVDALRDGQESVRLALLECLRVASGNPHTSPEARAMPTAALVKALYESLAGLFRMRDDALKARDAAERTAKALLGASAGPLRYYALAPDFDWHSNARLAQEAAEFALDQFRDQAGDGWDEDVEHIEWGVLMPCQSVAMVNEAPVDPASRFARAGMEYTCDYELRWVEGASGAQKPAADGPGLWVVRRPDETPALVVVGEGAAPPVTRIDGSDPGWGKYADRTDWTWERLPEAHAVMARVGYGEGHTDGAKAMRQYAAVRLAHRASERLAVSRSPKLGWHSRNLADAEAAVLGDAEREVRGLALPAVGVPRGE